MNVYLSNSTSNRGTPIAVDAMQSSSNGDVVLAHLIEPALVNQNMPLADSYDATAGDSGVIEGYSLRAYRVPTSGLYKAASPSWVRAPRPTVVARYTSRASTAPRITATRVARSSS